MKKKKVKCNSNSVNNNNIDILKAVVVNIANKQIKILYNGNIAVCSLPGSLVSQRNSLAVGDHVEISLAGNDQYKLIKILPRETALYRGDRRSPGNEILIAANVQYSLIIVTADYLLNQAGYLEAAIITARRSHIKLGLFISKWDLVSESSQTMLRDKLTSYNNMADFVITGSAREINAELIQAVKGKATVVIGDRGYGKTTLINSILCGLKGNVVDHDIIQSTHVCIMHVGPEETILIDTPGFRDFALNQITEDERNFVYPEIVRLSKKCYFGNCTHIHEEGCHVIEELRLRKIKKERYDSYCEIAEIASISPKANYRHTACSESFTCKACGTLVVPDGAGSQHRNHCPKCLSSVHVDIEPGDRASICGGIMDTVSVWVRKNGEWAIIHRCRLCGTLSSNRIAADDNPILLVSIAVRPLSMPPFPLNNLDPIKTG